MPKGPKGERRPADANAYVVKMANYTAPAPVRSGHAGAKARMAKTTQSSRKAAAEKAATARWMKGTNMSQLNRMVDNLFHDTGQEVCNVKFFLGESRSVTAEEVAEQVNLVASQERSGVTERSEDIDSDLKQTELDVLMNALK